MGEYWIVDYRNQRLEQYLLDTTYGGEKVYRKCLLEREDTLSSQVLPGFAVSVASLFSQEIFAEALRQLGR